MVVRAFVGDEARPFGPVLGEGGPLGVAEWQAEELEPPLQRPSRSVLAAASSPQEKPSAAGSGGSGAAAPVYRAKVSEVHKN